MDYRILLIRYMNHVMNMEWVAFIPSDDRALEYGFTPEDIEALVDVYNQVGVIDDN